MPRSGDDRLPASTPIEISVDRAGASTAVRVTGELDMATAPALVEACVPLEGPLALDLSGVGFIDSSGLQGVADVLEAHPGSSLLSPSPVVARLIEITGLDEAFPTDQTATGEPDPA